MHETHRSDPDFDPTTGLRFHRLESLIGAPSGALVIYIVAPPPQRLGPFLRRLVVTPDMHRIHHSDPVEEQQRNCGGYIPLWDHFFGTYRHNPKLGREAMGVGSAEIPERECLSLVDLLARPFRIRRGAAVVGLSRSRSGLRGRSAGL